MIFILKRKNLIEKRLAESDKIATEAQMLTLILKFKISLVRFFQC